MTARGTTKRQATSTVSDVTTKAKSRFLVTYTRRKQDGTPMRVTFERNSKGENRPKPLSDGTVITFFTVADGLLPDAQLEKLSLDADLADTWLGSKLYHAEVRDIRSSVEEANADDMMTLDI